MAADVDRPSSLPIHPKAAAIYSGGGLLVLDKPAGVLSHPNPGKRAAEGVLIGWPYDFKAECFRGPGPDGRRREVHLIHRLDRETSGLILLALDADLAGELKSMFYHRDVSKEYQALVKDAPKSREGTWRDALDKRQAGGSALRVTALRRGEPNAITDFRVVRRFAASAASLLALSPRTGRTHQLRVQAASRGYPIAGDDLYGLFAWNKELRREAGLKRMFLHAGRLSFRHPGTGEQIELESRLPEPLREVMERF